MKIKIEGMQEVSDGLFAIAKALDGISINIKQLGLSNAGTSIGAIEYLAIQIKSGFTEVADAIEEE